MKKIVLFLMVGAFCISLIGCAASAATAGYSVRAGSADDLNSNARKSMIDEAVDKAFSKCKEYIDNNFVKK